MFRSSDGLRRRVAAVTSERPADSEDRRIASLDLKVHQLAERVDTLAETVANAAAGLTGRDGELAALRRRLDEHARRPGGGSVDELLRLRIDDLGAATASLSMRLESQADQIAVLRDVLDTRDSELHAEGAALAERLEAAERERVALTASVAEAAAMRLSEVERTLVSLSERLDSVERDQLSSTARLGQATSLWPAALRSLEARVDELSSSASRRPIAGSDAPPVTTQSAPTPGIARFLDEIRGLERRLDSVDAAARQVRDELSARLQRLELQHRPGAEEIPIGADVLPFRGSET